MSINRRKYAGSDPTRRTVGWAIVVLVHVAVGWALVSGTARRGLEDIKKPQEAAVIQVVIAPPPPPPPPPPVAPPQPKQIKPPEPQAPRPAAPPPPFVPRSEFRPPATTAPTIESVPVPPPAPVVIAPPPAPVVIAPPAPPAPAPAVGQEIGLTCPTQVKPTMPARALKPGEEFVVRAQATIRDGNVVEVSPSGGNAALRSAVVAAMKQYKCVSSGGDIIATQEFVFRQE